MLGVYIAAAIIGGGLIAFSALAGIGSHADIGGDLGHGTAGHDHSGHDQNSENTWIPLLSLRFWTYCIGAFGLLGLLLSLTKVAQEPFVLIISSCTGLTMGLLASLVVKFLSNKEATSSISEGDFTGVLAKVTVPIRELPGKVRATIKGELIDLTALGQDGQQFEQGEEVLIIELNGNNATVARQSDFMGE